MSMDETRFGDQLVETPTTFRTLRCKTRKDWGMKSALQVVLCVFALIALFLITTALFLIYENTSTYNTKSDDRASSHVKFESNEMSPTSSSTSQTKGATSTPYGIQIASATQSLGIATSHQPNAEPCSCNYSSHEFPTSCQDVRKQTNTSGVFTIYPFHDNVNKILGVYCDQMTDGGNWMVIQRRVDNSVNFRKTWSWYKTGFGDLSENFWLGLENLHSLTLFTNYELRIDMTDYNNVTVYAKYRHFRIGGEESNYKLNISGYSGTAGDALAYHNGKPFSTSDKDNDGRYSDNCAETHNGGWWYGNGKVCYRCNLNGLYLNTPDNYWKGINWISKHSLRRTEMKIRRVL